MIKLEPKQLCPNTLLYRQYEPVEEIIFLINGKVQIGFNYDEFLSFQGFNFCNERKNSKVMKKSTKQQSQLSKMLSTMKQSKKNMDKSKYVFPVHLHPGRCILGIYEVSFNEEASYTYKTSKFSNSFFKSFTQQHGFDCFFIRRKNWKDLVKE